MSIRYWRYYPEARGALIAALALAAVGLCCWFVWFFWPEWPPIEGSVAPTEAEYLAKNLDADCIAALSRSAAPHPVDPNPQQTEQCADKEAVQKNNHAGLEQSIRSTNAAESSAYLSFLQTRIGIIGAILVFASLFLTAAAAIAASLAARGAVEAAEAARDATELSRQEFSLTHRPRLRVRKVIIPSPVVGEPIAIQAEIANVGNTKAILRFAEFRIETRPLGLGNTTRWSDVETIGAASTRHGSDGKPRELMGFISVGGTLVLKLTTSLPYRDHLGRRAELMAIRGDLSYDDTFLGPAYDFDARANFKATTRKTAFERLFNRRDKSGVLWFTKAKEPDTEFEYED